MSDRYRLGDSARSINSLSMKRDGLVHELTNFVDSKGNIWTNDGDMLLGSHKTSIERVASSKGWPSCRENQTLGAIGESTGLASGMEDLNKRSTIYLDCD